MDKQRTAPIELNPDDFRTIGYRLVDRIAEFLDTLPKRPVTTGETPPVIRGALDSSRILPDVGTDPAILIDRATNLLFDHSLFNSHPRFWGYITAAAAPIGILGDLAGIGCQPEHRRVVSLTYGKRNRSSDHALDRRTAWLSNRLWWTAGQRWEHGEYRLLPCRASGKIGMGCALRRAARKVTKRLRVYCSTETHTWIQKAADVTGIGTDGVRWIPTDKDLRMDVTQLRQQIKADREAGDHPLVVIGTAGSISTGAIDPLGEIVKVCREEDLWFHVDGAYGGFAAMLPDASPDLRALNEADSLAVDAHKWLYAPLEAGCVLVRDPEKLREAFAYHPPYYHFGVEAINYLDYGPQNSRGFRALKVWLALQHVGRKGYEQMLTDDIRLAKKLYELVANQPELEAFTHSLSISTFRYVPFDVKSRSDKSEEYLNQLNTELLTRLQNSGEAYLSNAVIDGKFALRACIVNFRTSQADIEALPDLVIRLGRKVDADLRLEQSKTKN